MKPAEYQALLESAPGPCVPCGGDGISGQGPCEECHGTGSEITRWDQVQTTVHQAMFALWEACELEQATMCPAALHCDGEDHDPQCPRYAARQARLARLSDLEAIR